MADQLARLKAALADRYAIQRELGRGGMATVYLARDLKHGRLVAIKVLRPEIAAALGPERFLREIEVAARLTHPHILALHDSGQTGGSLYYVMPYIEGDRCATGSSGKANSRSRTHCGSRARWRARWATRTTTMSSTGTSNQRTSCCRVAKR